MLEQIATGGSGSLLAVGAFDNLYAEGQAGELRIEMSSVPPGLATSLRAALQRTPGFDLLGVDQEGGGAGSFVLGGLATIGNTAVDIFTGGLFGIPDIPSPSSAPGAIIIRFRRGLLVLGPVAIVLATFFVGAILLLVTAWALFRDEIAAVAAAAADVAGAVADSPFILGAGAVALALGAAWLIFRGK